MYSAEAVELCPTDTDDILRILMERGFRFIHPKDVEGNIITVVGLRAHGSVLDVIRLDAETDVTAMRIPGEEQDILSPETVLWRKDGHLREVTTSRGSWGPGDHGRRKWLAATA
jgi:hypothetical protein